MENKKDPVPYIVFESTQAKDERTIRRLSNIIILLIVGYMIIFGAMFWYFSLPIEESISQEITDTIDSHILQKIGD